jgi:glycosyltransferase involved in cell wall biosynthesis
MVQQLNPGSGTGRALAGTAPLLVPSPDTATEMGAPRAGAPRVSVIIPTLNEARNLPHVLPFIPDDVHEVILVDGRSTDDTEEVARRLLPHVRIVHEPRKGKGVALRTGMRAARGEILVLMDADGSTDPREIPRFVAALRDGMEFAKGSRFMPGGGTADMTRWRWFGNQAFVVMVYALFGAKLTDLCYGYNACWKSVVPALELDGDGFEIETEMNLRALRAGLRVAEVPSFEADRIHGESNLRSIPDGFRVLRTILREFVRVPPPAVPRALPVPVRNDKG